MKSGALKKKTRIIDKILKQLTPERIKKELADIQAVVLTPELQKWVKEYEKVGDRDPFIWKWILFIIETTTLSSVLPQYRDSLKKTKFFGAMLVIILDDIIDKDADLKKFQDISSNIGLQEKQTDKKDNLCLILWQKIKNEIQDYPNFNYLKEIFWFDVQQMLNGLEFSYLVNKNLNLINVKEYWAHFPNTMQVMIYSMLDLMCSDFKRAELGIIRKNILEIQEMTRVGNWVSTWKRETGEDDFSSGIFAYLSEVKTGIDFSSESKRNLEKLVKKYKIEKRLMNEWEIRHKIVKKSCSIIKSFDLGKLLIGVDKLFFYEMASQNHK